MNSTFKYWEVSGSQQLVATGLDHITIDSGNNIIITSNAAAQPYQSIRFDTVSNPTFANVTAGAFFFANGDPLSGGAAATTAISTNPPANPVIGQFWLKDDTGELYVYYNDGDSSQWITPTGSAGLPGATGPAGSPGGATGATGVAGANGATGATGVAGIQGNIGPVGATGIQGNIGPVGATGPEFLISVGDSPPGSPQSGSLWWDSAAGSLFFYYVDTDSSQWVSAAVAAAGVGGAGGTSLGSRTTATVSTSSIENSATANVSITGFKGYNLYKVQSSHAAWIRIYTSNAARTADSSRSQGTDPTPDVGIVTEVITNGAQTVVLAPAVVGFNDESPVTTSVPLAVTNLSGGANIVAVTITLVQTEA